jgi:uncharacterized protein (DUF58 family)
MLVVDQRINMFFGSRVSMKSVVAAEVAALAAWRVFHQGDRVGAFAFNDDTTEEIRMHRSRTNVLRMLDRIVRQNHLLRSDFASSIRPERLNEVHLPAAEQLIVSDGELQDELRLGQEKVRKKHPGCVWQTHPRDPGLAT